MRVMRRKDRQMTEEDAKIILEKAEFGTLSMIGDENKPYGVPINFAYDGDDTIYLHCAVAGYKLDNIAKNNNVCFSAVIENAVVPDKFSSRFKSCIVFGTISVVEDDEEKRRGLVSMVKKYASDFYESGMKMIDSHWKVVKVLKIKIESLNGKHHK